MNEKQRAIWSWVLTGLLLIMCLGIGSELSQRKPLWNDEIYTQVNIDKLSYEEIFLNLTSEGNNCPLFYILQKIICGIFQFKFPYTWNGDWAISDMRSQVIMRISSNVFISFSLVAIFYFFSRFYSLRVGGYSLLVALSSPMIWAFWVEARPYPLWIFLTTMQSLLFLSIIREERVSVRVWMWLMATHILLALTLILSFSQIVIVSCLLWIFKERKWQKYVGLVIIPVAICLFYYGRSKIIGYWLPAMPMELIFENVPQDRILIFVMYFVLEIFYYIQQRRHGKKEWLEGAHYFVFLVLMFIAAFAFLAIVKLWSPPGREDSHLPSRYLVSLVPVEIIATTIFSVSLTRVFHKQKWFWINIIIVLGGLLMIRFLKTFLGIYTSGLY